MKAPKMNLKMTLIVSASITLLALSTMLVSINIAMSNLMQTAVDAGLNNNSDLQAIASFEWNLLLTITGTFFILISAIVMYIYKNFASPLQSLSKVMQKVSDDRDLGLRASERGGSEVAQISLAYNKMLSEFEELINSVSTSVGSLKEATQELSLITESSGELTATQQSESQQLATAMNEMSATSQEVAKNAADTASAVHDATSSAQHSAEIAVEAMCAMDNLVTEVDSAA
jgi:methyl-accepting chemotaxis protein